MQAIVEYVNEKDEIMKTVVLVMKLEIYISSKFCAVGVPEGENIYQNQ